MDACPQRPIKLRLKRTVPDVPAAPARYTIVPPDASEAHPVPEGTTSEEPQPDVLAEYEFLIPDVQVGTRTFSFGHMALGHYKLDRLTLFMVSRLFLCNILAGITKIPDFFLHTRRVSNWLATRICASLDCTNDHQTTFEIIGELFRRYAKSQITEVMTRYLDLHYVAVNKQPRDIFLAIIRDVCALPKEEEEEIIQFEDIHWFNWQTILETNQVLWAHGRPFHPNATPEENADADISSDDSADAPPVRLPAGKRRVADTTNAWKQDLQATKRVLSALKETVDLFQGQLAGVETMVEAAWAMSSEDA